MKYRDGCIIQDKEPGKVNETSCLVAHFLDPIFHKLGKISGCILLAQERGKFSGGFQEWVTYLRGF
jgi:hypothetical protein